MRKIFLVVVSFFILSTSAFADCASNLGINFTPNQRLSLCKNFGSSVGQSLIPSTDNTFDLGSSALQYRSIYVGTSLVYGPSAVSKVPAASVVTPFVTYAAGSAALTARTSLIAAGAPTSAFVELPAATANVGVTKELYNQGSNPVAIVPASGVINVSGALTPFSCTTLKKCTCQGLTTGVWGCAQQ